MKKENNNIIFIYFFETINIEIITIYKLLTRLKSNIYSEIRKMVKKSTIKKNTFPTQKRNICV